MLTKGTGTTHPKATDQVKVHYSGWTTDGKLFDSSVMRNEPIVFPLNEVIPGWTEGVQLMVEGEKRRLWIPAKLAYGENPPPGAPAGTLVFDVELLANRQMTRFTRSIDFPPLAVADWFPVRPPPARAAGRNQRTAPVANPKRSPCG